jgi:hypothetical protein
VDVATRRAVDAGDVTRDLDDCDLQAQANPEEGHALLARILHGRDLPLRAALTEAAGH